MITIPEAFALGDSRHADQLLARIRCENKTHEANARLIAAAPDMLAALRAMVEQECEDKPITSAEHMAVAAIAKAEARL